MKSRGYNFIYIEDFFSKELDPLANESSTMQHLFSLKWVEP